MTTYKRLLTFDLDLVQANEQRTGEKTISLYRQFHNIPLQKLPQHW